MCSEQGATGSLFTSPMGRGRRAAPGEGLRPNDRAKPLTRIASDDAIRPLPAGEVATARFIPSGSTKGRYQTRNDGLKRRIQISNSERICVRVLAARCARGLRQLHPPSEQRAQGKPDADCTRGRAHKKRTSDHRFNRITPAFPARMAYGLLRALPGDRLVCHRRPAD
jgi:hypothetical protein